MYDSACLCCGAISSLRQLAVADSRIHGVVCCLQWGESQVAAFEDRIQTGLRMRTTKLQANIDKLNQRVADLEQKFEEDKEAMMKEIAERNARLTKQLNEFQVRTLCSTPSLVPAALCLHLAASC